MTKEILLKSIKLDGVVINISDDRIYKYNLDKKDWLVYILFEYNNKLELVFRKSIEIDNQTKLLVKESVGKRIIIKLRCKTIIGEAIVQKNLNLRPVKFYKKGKFYECKDYKVLFKHYKDNEKYNDLSNEELKKYISGLFKIYYDSIKYLFSMNNTTYIGKKQTAMASYNAIKNSLFKYKFSQPNVFIRNKMIEYDALILKGDINDNYCYDKEEVCATIEIKSSGARTKNMNDYIKHISGTSYDEERISEIPHIYFSIFEQLKSYNEIVRKMKDVIIIVCASKVDNDTFLIPKEYDIDKILNL